MKKSRLAHFGLVAMFGIFGACLFHPESASATDGTWNIFTPGSYNWDDVGNWTPAIADGASSVANFTGDPLGDIVVTLQGASRTVGTMVFSDTGTGTAASWTINATGSNKLNINNGASAGIITVNALAAGSTATINAPLTATAGFTKNGAGELRIGAAYDSGFTGPTIVDGGGTLTFAADNSNVKALQIGIVTANAGDTTIGKVNINANVSTTGFAVQTNSATNNTLSIAAGKTLAVNGNFNVGFDIGAIANNNNIDKLVVAAGDANSKIVVAGTLLTVGNTGTGSPPTTSVITSTLDLSALNSFTFTGGAGSAVNIGFGNRSNGTLILPNSFANPSSTITATTFNLGGNNGGNNGGATNQLTLGSGSNNLNANTFNFGLDKSNSAVSFGGASGSLKIRNSDLVTPGRAAINIAVSVIANTSGVQAGTVTLTGHSVDILASTIVIGARTRAAGGGAGISTGNLSFDTGTIDTTALSLAVRSGSAGVTTGGPVGILTIGGTGLMKVGTGGLSLATNTIDSALSPSGTINLNGGTLQSNSDITIGLPGVNVGANTYAATINLNGGTLDLLDSQTSPTKLHHDIGTATLPIPTLNFTSGTLKDVGTINGTAGITKTGTGRLILAGNNFYTGDTTINAGTVVVTGKLVGTGTTAVPLGTVSLTNSAGFLAGNGAMGAVTLSTGASIRPGLTELDGAIGTLTMASLTNNGGEMRFDLTTPAGTYDKLAITGQAFFGSGSTISIAGTPATGDYTVATFGSLGAGSSAPAVALPPNTRTIPTSSFVGNSLVVHASAGASLTWTGANGANWDLADLNNSSAGTQNWSDNGGATTNQKFFNLDNATFGNGPTNRDINIIGTVQPNSVTVNNDTNNPYKFSGADISGVNTTLTKSGTGTLTIANSNTYAGATTINNGVVVVTGGIGSTSGITIGASGVLQIGDGTAGGNGSSPLNNGTNFPSISNSGVVAFNRTDGTAAAPTAISNIINGNGGVQQIGTGVVQLIGLNSYTGNTTIGAGATLQVRDSNSLGATSGPTVGNVTVVSGGTLDLEAIAAPPAVVSFGSKMFFIAGSGVGGGGAIAHSGANPATNAFQFITLQADATINAGQRINIGSATANGILDLAGHTLTKSGGNSFGISNTSVTDGNIHVTTGRLEVIGGTQILAGVGTSITFDANTQASFQGTAAGSITRPIIFAGAAQIGTGTSAVAQVNSDITLQDNLLAKAFNADGTGTLNLAGNISGAKLITKDIVAPDGNAPAGYQGDILTLSGSSNSFAGLIIENGIVQMGSATGLNSTIPVTFGIGAVSAPILRLNGNSNTIGNILLEVDINNNPSGANSFIENNAASAATLTVANSAASVYPGTIQDGAGGGKLSLTSAGSGTLTLSGSSTYTGNTTVTGGSTLAIAGSLQSTTLNIQNGTLQNAPNSSSTAFPHNAGLTLGGASTSGTFDLNGGTATVAALTSGATGASNIITNTGGSGGTGAATLIFAHGVSTFGGSIKDKNTSPGNTATTALTIGDDDQNPSSLTLTGASTYLGDTNIRAKGTLIVNGSLAAAGNVNINGGTLGGSGSVGKVTINSGSILPGNTVGTLTMNSLSLNSGDIRFDLPASDTGTHDKIVLAGAGTQLNFSSGTLTPVNPGSLAIGTYTLLSYPAATSVSGSPILNVPDNTRADFKNPSHFHVTSTAVSLDVVATPLNLTWVGAANSATWDVGSAGTTNWSNNGTQAANDKFFNLDTVNFTDASNNRTVNLSASVSPAVLNVNNSTLHDYIFNSTGGAIDSDATQLVKSGAGKLTINTTNTFGGGTSLSGGGTIQLGTGATAGNLGTGPVAGSGAGGTLLFGSSGFLQFNNAISGPISVAVDAGASGSVTLGGLNSYSGTTAIKSGTLQLGAAGALPTGANVAFGNATGATSGTLDISNQTVTVGALSVAGGTANAITASNGTLVFSGGTSTFSGALQNSLNLTGHSGTLILAGLNTYNGITATDAGATLQFGNGGTAGNIGQGTINNNGTVAFNRSDDIDISSQSITGTGSVTYMGPGKVTVSSTNGYSGNTLISGGTVAIPATLTAPSGTSGIFGGQPGGSVTIAAGGTLDLSNDLTANDPALTFGAKQFFIAGSGVGGIGAIVNNGASQSISGGTFQLVTLTADATVNAGQRIDIRNGTPVLDLAGHTLTKIGTGIFTFFTGNITDGNIDVQQGNLNLSFGATVNGNGLITIENGASISLRQETAVTRAMRINGVGSIQQGFATGDVAANIGSNLAIANSGATAGNARFQQSASTVMTWFGNISDANPANPGGLTMNGSGATLTLTGNNTYSGGTTVTSGTLIMGSNTALGGTTGPLTINGPSATPGTLDLNGHNLTVGAFGGGNVTNNFGTIISNAAGPVTLTFGSAAATAAPFAGTIQNGLGTVSLVKNGSDSTTLSGVNTYTGTTTINAGTLALGVADAISTTTGVTLGGGKLATGGFSHSLNAAPLQVSAPSIIDLGFANAGETLHFANSSSWSGSAPAGSLLRINNWSTSDHVTFPSGGITLAQAQLTHFTGIRGVGKLDVTGTEIVPANDPTNIANQLMPGDTTGDHAYSGADLDQLLVALTNPAAFIAGYPGGLASYEFPDVTDVNRDGSVDNLDIQAEISTILTGTPPAPPAPAPSLGGSNLAGGPGAVPEPASFVLLGLGGLFCVVRAAKQKLRRVA